MAVLGMGRLVFAGLEHREHAVGNGKATSCIAGSKQNCKESDRLFLDAVERARHAGTTIGEVAVLDVDEAVGADELTVLLSEMCDDLTAFLTRRGGDGPTTLAQCISELLNKCLVGLLRFTLSLDSSMKVSVTWRGRRASITNTCCWRPTRRTGTMLRIT